MVERDRYQEREIPEVNWIHGFLGTEKNEFVYKTA
jgi:hypothetical protein